MLAAGIGSRNDDEIGVDLVTCATAVLDLHDEIVGWNHVHLILVIVRALRKQLVFDMDASNAGTDELAYCPDAVKRLAEARTSVRQNRNVDAGRHRSRSLDLIGHGQQRFSDIAREPLVTYPPT